MMLDFNIISLKVIIYYQKAHFCEAVFIAYLLKLFYFENII